jgi:hypothetical protein
VFCAIFYIGALIFSAPRGRANDVRCGRVKSRLFSCCFCARSILRKWQSLSSRLERLFDHGRPSRLQEASRRNSRWQNGVEATSRNRPHLGHIGYLFVPKGYPFVTTMRTWEQEGFLPGRLLHAGRAPNSLTGEVAEQVISGFLRAAATDVRQRKVAAALHQRLGKRSSSAGDAGAPLSKVTTAAPKRHRISAEGLRRIRAAQRKRWAAGRKAQSAPEAAVLAPAKSTPVTKRAAAKKRAQAAKQTRRRAPAKPAPE